MSRRTAAALSALGAAVLGLGAPVIAGLARPGYDACAQFISELGELGAVNGELVSLGVFLPTGLLLLAFLALAAPYLVTSRASKVGVICLAAVPAAYVAAAFARCDPGCPASGSDRQLVHNAFGALEYLGGALGLLLLGGSFRSAPEWPRFALPSVLAAALVFGSFVALLALEELGLRGALQRVAETTLFVWVAAVGVRLLAPAPAFASRP